MRDAVITPKLLANLMSEKVGNNGRKELSINLVYG